MKGAIDTFPSGWIGLSIGIKTSEIDRLIESIQELRISHSHFHLRSEFNGDPGIGDIEIYLLEDSESDNLTIDSSKSIYPPKKQE